MKDGLNGRPFTRAVEDLRLRGMRYADLEQDAGRARSTAWFNKLLNSNDPWAVSPPDSRALDKLAHLLNTTRRRVAEMIAEEWYGVSIEEQSTRVRSLASRIDALDSEDAKLLENLIQRLQPANG